MSASKPTVLRLCVRTGDWWAPATQDESCPHAECDGEHANYLPAKQRIGGYDALHALIERAEREGLEVEITRMNGRWAVEAEWYASTSADSLNAACRAVLDALDGRDGA